MRVVAQIGAVLLCASLIGCDDSKPGSNADAGRDGASGGASSGTGGSTGTGGMMGPLVKPRFRAHLDGLDVILETTGQAWADTCQNSITIEKRTSDGWTPLRDDTPRSSGSGHGDYYLYDGYVPAQDNGNACDMPKCVTFQKTQRIGRSEEYVKTGTKPRPASAGLPAGDIAVIETRPYHGELGVSLRYSDAPGCSSAKTTRVPVMGSEGVEDAGTEDAGR